MKRILFDAAYLIFENRPGTSRSGVFQVVRELFRELALQPGIELVLHAEPMLVPSVRAAVRKILPEREFAIIGENTVSPMERVAGLLAEKIALSSGLLRCFWRLLFQLPKRLSRQEFPAELLDGFDGCLSLSGAVSPAFRKHPELPVFLYCHDLIALRNFHYDQRAAARTQQLLDSWQKSDRIFTNSAFTRQELLAARPEFSPEQVKVLYPAAASRFSPAAGKGKKPYLFALCSIEPRKNLPAALRAFDRFCEKHPESGLKFYLGGGVWETFAGKFQHELKKLRFAERVHPLGYLPDEALPKLYAEAEIFLYPSLAEGFGLPVLEAMQSGTPVITGNGTSLPEVAGDAALLIDPTDETMLEQAIEKLHGDPELRKTLAVKGIDRAKNFSWRQSAEALAAELQDRHAGVS